MLLITVFHFVTQKLLYSKSQLTTTITPKHTLISPGPNLKVGRRLDDYLHTAEFQDKPVIFQLRRRENFVLTATLKQARNYVCQCRTLYTSRRLNAGKIIDKYLEYVSKTSQAFRNDNAELSRSHAPYLSFQRISIHNSLRKLRTSIFLS